VQAAARHYFGPKVNARNLSLRQSALLAGLVRNPNGYDPTRYPDKALERRNVVLQRMADLNVISQTRADKVKDKDLGLKVQKDNNGCLDFSAQSSATTRSPTSTRTRTSARTSSSASSC